METVIIKVKNERDCQKLIGYSINNGWQAQSFNSLLNKFVENAPKDVPLTDDEIIAEINNVRQNGGQKGYAFRNYADVSMREC